MTKKSRWPVMLCIASLFIAVGGCSDDDDVFQPKQVSADQAAALVEEAVPFILEFGSNIADLLEAVNSGKAADRSNKQACVPIPGLESDYFCTVPEDGAVCPVNETTTEWVFSNCLETGFDPGILDGTVTVTESGNSFDLLFALDVDSESMTGSIQVTLGESCVTVNYSDFELGTGGGSNTINGDNTLCDDDSVSGTLSVTVDASGIQRFLMEIDFTQGILIISPSTQEILYSCTYNPQSETAQCFPYGEF
jgi:hypothetical protein